MGFLTAIALAMRQAGREGEDPAKIMDLAFYVIIAAIAGSRLLYVALHYKYYLENPIPPDQKYKSGDLDKKRKDARELAEWTQERDYPYNWVASYVGSVKRPFIYGLDYLECGNLKLCKHLGITGFTKYICMLDNILYTARGQGVTRTTTLADGFDRCDFRYSEDGVVSLEEPFTVEKLREWGKT